MTPADDTRAILAAVAEKHGVSVEAILGPRKLACVVRARDEAIATIHKARPDWSFPRLGRLFNRDHTSILAALDRRKFRERNRAWARKARWIALRDQTTAKLRQKLGL